MLQLFYAQNRSMKQKNIFCFMQKLVRKHTQGLKWPEKNGHFANAVQ